MNNTFKEFQNFSSLQFIYSWKFGNYKYNSISKLFKFIVHNTFKNEIVGFKIISKLFKFIVHMSHIFCVPCINCISKLFKFIVHAILVENSETHEKFQNFSSLQFIWIKKWFFKDCSDFKTFQVYSSLKRIKVRYSTQG